MTLAPWEYLFLPFNSRDFPDLFWPISLASLAIVVAQVVLYNVLTRRYRRYEPLVTMQEWMLWTGVISFSLVIVGAVFVFYFVFVLAFIGVGTGVYLWARFVRWPPLIAAYNEDLHRSRFFSQAKYKHPEATIRSRRRRRRGR